MLTFLHEYAHTHHGIESRIKGIASHISRFQNALVRVLPKRQRVVPHRFEIRNGVGEIVTSGALPTESHEAMMRRMMWRCTTIDLPSYSVHIFDGTGGHVAMINGRRTQLFDHATIDSHA